MIVLILFFSWENVDTGNCGTYSSITSAGDTLFVSYYDIDDGDLKFAWKVSGGNWNYRAVDSGGDVGLYTSIYYYQGVLWISYYDNTNGDLKCAYGSGNSFNVELVDQTGNVGLYSSMVVKNGVPHIFYYDATNGQLKHAYKSGSNWLTEVIDNTNSAGLWTSAFLASNWEIYVSYYSQGDNTLHVAILGTVWSITNVDNGGKYSSIAVEGNGTVHISYQGSSGGLMHAYGIPPDFTIDTVNNDPQAGYWTDIVLDQYGQPIISYVFGVSTYYLNIARYVDGVWDHYSMVDTIAGSNGTSITLMNNDGYISYFKGNPVNGLRVMSIPQLGIDEPAPHHRIVKGVFDLMGRRGAHGRVIFRDGKKEIILK